MVVHSLCLCEQLFSVAVTSDKGHSLSADTIASQLEQVVAQSNKPGIPVGVLTSDHRDNWSQVYKDLVAGGSILLVDLLLLGWQR